VREVVVSPNDEIPKDRDMIESQEPPEMMISHKRNLACARELIQDGEKYGAPKGTMRHIKKPNPFSSYIALMCDLIEKEPTCFQEHLEERMGRCHDKRIPIHYKE
jgi:hypothetical protein